MKENYYTQKMKSKSDNDLRSYLENKENFQEEEVIAAKWEFEQRGLIETKTAQQENISKSKKLEGVESAELGVKVDEKNTPNTLEETNEYGDFPPKPVEETKQQSINKSIISLGLFIGAFYLIFKWEFAYILVLAGVIFIHELGHYLAMRAFKYKDLAIFFVPLIGAFASGTKDNISQKQSVTVLLAGPLPGIVIGVIIYYFGLRDQNEFLLRTSNIFILLNLFNLLPVMPLDGGRLLKSMFFENRELISKIFIFISIGLLAFYALKAESYFLLIIPFFLVMQLNAQSYLKKVRQGTINKGIDLDKSYSELTNEEYWLIRDEIGIHMKYFERFITPKRYVVSENENKIIEQVNNVIQKKPTKDLKVSGKILITIFWLLTFVIPMVVIAIYYISLGIDV